MNKARLTGTLLKSLCLAVSFFMLTSAAGCSLKGGLPSIFSSSSKSTPVSPEVASIIAKARSAKGARYKWGGNSPSEGFDCSGLVYWVYASHGIYLPRVSWQQYSAGTFVNRNDIQPGDLVFYKINKTGKSMHVGIVTERGTFVHAPSSGKHVMESRLDNPFWQEHYTGARRPM